MKPLALAPAQHSGVLPRPCPLGHSHRASVCFFNAELLPTSGLRVDCSPWSPANLVSSYGPGAPLPLHQHSHFTLFYFLSSSKWVRSFYGRVGLWSCIRPEPKVSSIWLISVQDAFSVPTACAFPAPWHASTRPPICLSASPPPEQNKTKLSFKGRQSGHLLIVDPDSGLFRELMMTKPKPSFSFRWMTTSLVCRLWEAKPSGGEALPLGAAWLLLV